jgi:Tol biopolymer transport system component/DNA-binding winged helix-turn-helix (wHTH) protein
VIDSSRKFRLGRWRVLPDRNQIVGRSGAIRVEPMVMRLLCLLAENGAATTTRDAIIERLWDGRAVTDEAITKQISKLRAVLGDDPREPEVIATVQKVGVRLLVPVSQPQPRWPPGGRARWLWVSTGLAWAVVAALWLGLWLWRGPQLDIGHIKVRPLTAETGSEVDPALSPDGAWLAYAARAPQEPGFGLYLRLMADDRARRVTPPAVDARAPAWSDDGRFAYVAHQAGGCAILVGSPLGPARRVGSCVAAEAGGLAWDGSDGVIVSDRSGLGQAFHLERVDLKTGARRVLTRPPAGSLGDFHPLAHGPGGRTYFVRSMTVGPGEVFALDGSGRVRQVSHDNARITGLAYAVKGGLLVASDREDGIGALWRLDPRGPWWRKFAPGPAPELTASANGRTVVFPLVITEIGLWSVPATGGEGAALAASTGMDWSPVLSPDGRSLAYLSDRSGSWEVWLADADGGGARQLSHLGGPAIQDPAWSPDGKAVAVAVPRDGQFDIVRIEAATGVSRPLVQTSADERYPAFSPDGRALYFTRRQGARYALMRRELAGGGERLVQDSGMRALPSADGTSLYFGRPFQPGLWRVSLKTDQAARISEWPDWVGARNWTLADGMIWGLAPEAGGARLMRLDPASGRQAALGKAAGLSRRSGLAVIGGRIVYARTIRQESDLVALIAGR